MQLKNISNSISAIPIFKNCPPKNRPYNKQVAVANIIDDSDRLNIDRLIK